jgi:hypothetical protein
VIAAVVILHRGWKKGEVRHKDGKKAEGGVGV